MNTSGWLQLALFVGALALITKPMGLYLMRVLDPKGKTWLDPVIRPVERLSYWVMGVRPEQEQDLEAIHLGDVVVQPGELPVHLRHSAAAKFSAAQSAGLWRL
jgi:K+-transporting ATPase A subunit